ncbi:MAG TPA: tyrosine-type recombinase/integrase [Micromonosporaceae bacterium]|nr:tyrosine-type recombinase/integrase [Micromonosporaceae bacterium]
MARTASRVDVAGLLRPYQAGFEAVLADAGYAPLSAANQVRLMRHLSIWLGARGLQAADLTPAVVQEYLASRRADGYTCWLSLRGLAPLLAYLRGLGVAPALVVAVSTGPLDVVMRRYRRYLVTERGLAPATVRYHLAHAGVFLAGWVDAGGSRLGEISAAKVSAFVVEQCAHRGVGSAKTLVTVLRSLLRFLLLEGLVTVDLSGAVPAVAGWRGGYLPKAIGPVQVTALLATCDRRRVAARRDRAVLLLLVRLGLRAGEVAGLQMEDLDWRRGELRVRGKGRRDERLPLPVDVGEAVVDYLRHDRPPVAGRALFINVRVPYSPMTAGAVQAVVIAAAGRAGIEAVSAHRLRHTAATQMLRAQAGLAEVGQVLRHRSACTTAIYAKVDRDRLGELALAWPQVNR